MKIIHVFPDGTRTPDISLTEADGGMWKLAARNAVKTYLRNALAEEVYKDQVIVTL